ncbi:MAG: hypothetical protein Tsb0013_05910 [Phycisphaerales bacterium]
MCTTALLIITLLAFALLSACTTTVTPEDPVLRTVERHVFPLLEGEHARGVVVGVERGDDRLLRAYGDLPAGTQTLFETGSIGKVFTALLLVEAVRRGEMALDEPVPASWGLRHFTDDAGEHPVLLWHLATHTSGLSASPDDLDDTLENPYEGYTLDRMRRALARAPIGTRPGASYAYSNLAYALLGQLLAERADVSYTELLHRRILDPMFMGSDGRARAWTHLGQAQQRDLAPGHEFGVPREPWGADDALAPAGCVITGADALLDMLRLAHDAHTDPSCAHTLAPSLRDTLAIRFPFPDGGGVGLGWHHEPHGAIWHNGSTGGYHATAAFDPAHDLRVVILADDADPLTTEVSFRLLDALRGIDDRPVETTPVAAWDERREHAVVGAYRHDGAGLTLEITREDGRLLARLTGQPAVRVFPIDQSTVVYRVVDAQLEVVDGAECVAALVLHQDGVSTRFERVE